MPQNMSKMSEKEQNAYLVEQLKRGTMGIIDLDFVKERASSCPKVKKALLEFLGLGEKESLWFSSMLTLGEFRKRTFDFPNETILLTRGHDGNGMDLGITISGRDLQEAVGEVGYKIQPKIKAQIRKAPQWAITVENP